MNVARRIKNASKKVCSLPGCDLPGTGICFYCSDTSYCSSDHQKEHWAFHQQKCPPFERRKHTLKTSNDDVGLTTHISIRASRDLRPGQHVILEKPVVTFPNVDYDSLEFSDEHGFGLVTHDYNRHPLIHAPEKPEVCFGCYQAEPDGLKFCCSRCQVPICSASCEDATVHQAECTILPSLIDMRNKFNHPAVRYLYMDISTLRILLLRRSNAWIYEKVMMLALDPRVVHYRHGREFRSLLRSSDILQLLPLSSSFAKDSQEVLNACLIALVMGHVNVHDHRKFKCIYPVISAVAHSCVPNMELVVTAEEGAVELQEEKQDPEAIDAADNVLTAVATMPIAAGTVLTIDLVPKPFLGRRERQEMLRRKCVLRCTCPRCLSPTDLGTFSNAVKCTRCGPGYLLPQWFVLSCWTCLHCETFVDSSKIYELVTEAATELTAVMNINSAERWDELTKLQRTWKLTLHPNHYLVLIAMREEAKLVENTIMNGIGALKVIWQYSLRDSAAKHYAQMKDHCTQLLRFLNISRPGFTLARAKILRQLFFVDFVFGAWEFKMGRIEVKPYLDRLKRGIAVLRESCLIINHYKSLQPTKKFYTTELLRFVDRIEKAILLFATPKSNKKTIRSLLIRIGESVLKPDLILSLENEQLLDLS